MSKGKKRNNKLNKTCTFYVEGMHCASCEILIEKKLLKEDNISFANATLSESKVEINYQGTKPNLDEINEKVSSLGYEFTEEKVQRGGAIFEFKNGELQINFSRVKFWMPILIAVLLLLIGYELLKSNGLVPSFNEPIDSNASLPIFGSMGLFAGVSTCAALVGGVILSMSKQWNEAYIAEDSKIKKFIPHTLFHSGRLLGFLVLGGVLGGIFPLIINILGKEEANFFTSSGYLTITSLIVNLIILILALQMLGVRWANKISLKPPKKMSSVASNQAVDGKLKPFLIGIYSFFIPCSYTLLAQSAALTSGNVLTGALIMFSFALGTVIPLSVISMSSVGLNGKPHLTAKFNAAIGLFLVIISVFALLDLSANILATNQSATTEIAEIQFAPINEDGVQVVKIEAKGSGYSTEDKIFLQKDIPAVFEIDNQGTVGCYSFVKIRGLVDNFFTLNGGMNYMEFTPDKSGVFSFDCAMEMSPKPLRVEVI